MAEKYSLKLPVKVAGEMIKSGQYLRFGAWLAKHPEDFPTLNEKSRVLAEIKCVENYLKTDEAQLFQKEREEAQQRLTELQGQIK